MRFGKSQPGDEARDKAARLLVTPSALVELSLADAREVVNFMQPLKVPAGTVFIHEGEVVHTDYLLLVLDGEVTVEHEQTAANDSLVMSVMGPGSLIGEMGLLDGAPRSATCTAATDLAVAMLSRDALQLLIQDRPGVAARFLLSVSKSLSDRLRETNRKLKTLTVPSVAIQGEPGP